MRLPNDRKRQQILTSAAKLFARQRYDQVRLDDVAAAAGVGKGTLYVYFDNKDQLYFTIAYEGFSDLIEQLEGQLADRTSPAADRLRRIVEGLVQFARSHPQFYEMMRLAQASRQQQSRWRPKREALTALIRNTIADGIARGEFADPHPELTALFVPGFVRSAMLFGPKDLDLDMLIEHIHALLMNGIRSRREGARQ
jgi:AcrR family transcriptional regulator